MKKILFTILLLILFVSAFAEFPPFTAGFTPANTYKQILFVYNGTGDENTGLSTTLNYVMDGGGNAAPFKIATTSIRMDTGAKIEFSSADMFIHNDGANSLTINGDETVKLVASNEIDLTTTNGTIDINVGSGSVEVDGATNIAGILTSSVGLKSDDINEVTASHGVDIDGVSIKDGGFDEPLLTDEINEYTTDSGVFVEETLLKDSDVYISNNLYVDTISEKITNTGVTIDGVLLKDNNIDTSGEITIDDINEHTGAAGVTIDGVVVKDGGVTATNHVTTALLDAYGTIASNKGITTSNILLGKLSDGSVLSPTIGHYGNLDTYLEFDSSSDKMTLVNGGKALITTENTGQDNVFIGDGTDVDFQVKSEPTANAFFVRGSDGYVGVNTTGFDARFTVEDTYAEDVASISTGNIELGNFSNGSFSGRLFNYIDPTVYMEISGLLGTFVFNGGKLGVGRTSPKVALDVAYDPTGLSDNTGGGEVVYFGTEDVSEVLQAGRLMFLASSGTWYYADASDESLGGNCMLGIALGTDITDGILIRGFFDNAAYFADFTVGETIYVDNVPGYMTTNPSATVGEYVRAIGYCTSTTNVIYFNPDGHYSVN